MQFGRIIVYGLFVFLPLPAVIADTPVPLPCKPEDCKPVPNPLPGCPTCPTKPAPGEPDYPRPDPKPKPPPPPPKPEE